MVPVSMQDAPLPIRLSKHAQLLEVHRPWRVRSGFCNHQAHSHIWELSSGLAQRRHRGRLLDLLTEQAMQTCHLWGLAWCRHLYRSAIFLATYYVPSPTTVLKRNVYQTSYPGFQSDLHILQLEYTPLHYTARHHLVRRSWLPEHSLVLVIHSPLLSIILQT